MQPPEHQSPLPQPSAYTCPRCGFGWNEPRAYCPNCGAAQNQVSGAPAALGGCAIALYLCGFLLFGAVGACFSLVGLGGVFEGTPGAIFNPFTLIGLVGIAAALACIFFLIKGATRR